MTSPPRLVYLGNGDSAPSRAHALLAEQFQLLCIEAPDEGKLRAIASGCPFSLWATTVHTRLALSVAAADPQSIQALVLEAPESPSVQDGDAALGTISVPTLVVFGTRDRVVPAETGRVYREQMPHCNYVLLFDAAHDPAAERPEAFASLVSDFLTRREAFVVSQRSTLLHP